MSSEMDDFRHRLIHEAYEIFEELGAHRGCDASLLDELEKHFGGGFPPTYRRLMLLSADRMSNIDTIYHPSKLKKRKQDAEELLVEDGFAFRLQPNHVVFGWEDIYGFYFFEACGRDDVPVYLFNYYDDSDGQLPRECSPNVWEYLGWVIRRYLRLEH